MAQLTLFLSYSRRDKRTVDAIADALDKHRDGMVADQPGFLVLQDKSEHRPPEEQRLKGIHAFEDWWLRLQRMIESADVIVFCLSPASVASDVCEREIRHAAALNKKLAPILLEDTPATDIPPELSRLDWVDFTDNSRFEYAIDRLIDGLIINVDWLREQTSIGASALEWERSGRSSKLLLRGIKLDAAEKWRDSRAQAAPEITSLQSKFIAESRRIASGRLRALLSSVLVVLALVAGLAVGLWIFLNESRRQTRIADAQLLTARSQILSTNHRNRLDASLVYAAVATRRLRAEGADASRAEKLVLQARTLLTARPLRCSVSEATEARCAKIPDPPKAGGSFAETLDGDRSARVDEEGITFFDRDARITGRAAGIKSVKHIHFSRDGEYLAVMFHPLLADRFDVAVLDARTGALSSNLRHDGRVSAIAIHPSLPLVATASGSYWPEDRTVSVWSLKTGRELRRSILDSSPDGLRFDAMSSDLLIVGGDGMRWIWRVDPPLERAFNLKKRFGGGLFSPHAPNRHFISLSGGEACLWDLKQAGARRCTGRTSETDGIEVSNSETQIGVIPDGRLLALNNNGSQMCIVAPSRRVLVRQKCHVAPSGALLLAVSRNADWVIGMRGAQLCRWRFAPAVGLHEELCRPVTAKLSGDAVVLSSQGSVIINKAAKENSPIAIELASGREFLARKSKAADWEIARFSGCGKYVAISEATGDYKTSYISVFSLATETAVAQLQVDARVLSMEFSHDGTVIALGTEQTQNLHIWSWRTYDPPISLNTGLPVQAITFSLDDEQVVAAVGPRIKPYLEVRSFPTPGKFGNAQACELMARPNLESALEEVRTIIDVEDMDATKFCAN